MTFEDKAFSPLKTALGSELPSHAPSLSRAPLFSLRALPPTPPPRRQPPPPPPPPVQISKIHHPFWP